MGLLDRILSFLFGPSTEERIRDKKRKEIGPDFPPEPDNIFQRKILKSAFSERRGNRITEIFALTFEDNFTDRFNELAKEIQDYSESHNLFFKGEQYGYDDQQETRIPPFIYPTIEVGEE